MPLLNRLVAYHMRIILSCSKLACPRRAGFRAPALVLYTLVFELPREFWPTPPTLPETAALEEAVNQKTVKSSSDLGFLPNHARKFVFGARNTEIHRNSEHFPLLDPGSIASHPARSSPDQPRDGAADFGAGLSARNASIAPKYRGLRDASTECSESLALNCRSQISRHSSFVGDVLCTAMSLSMIAPRCDCADQICQRDRRPKLCDADSKGDAAAPCCVVLRIWFTPLVDTREICGLCSHTGSGPTKPLGSLPPSASAAARIAHTCNFSFTAGRGSG